MRLRDLEPGRWYHFRTGLKRSSHHVGLLLDVEPWVEGRYTGRPGPRPWDAELDRPYGRTRNLPILKAAPFVRLLDGTRHPLEFGYDLNVGHADGAGWSDRGLVRPDQVDVDVEPILLEPVNVIALWRRRP